MEIDNSPRTTATSESEGRLKASFSSMRRKRREKRKKRRTKRNENLKNCVESLDKGSSKSK